MNAPTKNRAPRIAAISSVLALVFSLSAQAGLYTYNYSDSGPIPQGGTTLSFEHNDSAALSPFDHQHRTDPDF